MQTVMKRQKIHQNRFFPLGRITSVRFTRKARIIMLRSCAAITGNSDPVNRKKEIASLDKDAKGRGVTRKRSFVNTVRITTIKI